MKIALVVTGGLHPSGREQVIPELLRLIERLARQHEVHAFALRHLPEPATYRLHGAAIHDLGRPQRRWRQWRRLLAALQTTGPFDVIHAYWVDPAGLLTALAGRRLHVPTLVTCNSGEFTALPDIDYGLQRSLRGRAAVTVACRLATAVHVTSEYMELLARQHGIHAVRIPPGIPFEAPAPPRLRQDGPPWRLLQIATLSRVKDQSMLLRAMAIVRRTLDVHLDLVGEDTLDGRLQHEAAALGLNDAVTFHGVIPHDALSPFHRDAHLYVQSSLHEAAGVAVLEAAAAGVPVVGTRVGFVSDWDGAGAVAVPPGNPEALAQAIVHLLQHPEQRYAIAHVAREWARRHDAEHGAEAMMELYRSLRVSP